MITWHYITSAAFKAADEAVKTSDKMFFLSDTKQIYRGTENFTESVILYTDLPATPAVGKLYIDSATLEGKMYNGTAWTTVIQPVQASLTSTDTAKPVSGKAVADYVKTQIEAVTGSGDIVKGVTFDSETLKLKVAMADGTNKDVDISMASLAGDLVYDKTSGKLQVKNLLGTTIGDGVDLDLERFVKSASYDAKTHKITLVFNDEKNPIEIDVADLVDTYTAGADTTTVHVDITENAVTASVKVSATEGNLIETKEDGLYVGAPDVTGKANKVTKATAGHVATLTEDGDIADGAVALADLATTANVNAIKETLQGNIDGKMAKVAAAAADQIIIAGADGDAAASGKKIGGETFAETPDAVTVATEKGVVGYVTANAVAKSAITSTIAGDGTASADKVASEKAVADSLTWKTTL